MTPKQLRDAANRPWEGDEGRRDACRAHPDPVNMPHELVVCWECGAHRKTSRDAHGHAYCDTHRDLWGRPPLTPR